MPELYRLLFTKSARRELEHLPRQVLELLKPRLDELIRQPRPHGCQKLTGTPYYRIRQGDYRVLYAIDDGERLVEIIKIGHRREVYR
jgi:mRNA interferase RelE/StbE